MPQNNCDLATRSEEPNAKNRPRLQDLTIHAPDGRIGTVQDFYFDDVTWAIRYWQREAERTQV